MPTRGRTPGIVTKEVIAAVAEYRAVIRNDDPDLPESSSMFRAALVYLTAVDLRTKDVRVLSRATESRTRRCIGLRRTFEGPGSAKRTAPFRRICTPTMNGIANWCRSWPSGFMCWLPSAKSSARGVTTMETTYIGTRSAQGCRVVKVTDQGEELLDLRLDLPRHSPSGADFGYAGSGPHSSHSGSLPTPPEGPARPVALPGF
jgi:hypothetical protein